MPGSAGAIVAPAITVIVLPNRMVRLRNEILFKTVFSNPGNHLQHFMQGLSLSQIRRRSELLDPVCPGCRFTFHGPA